ncbi:atrial natriuretic peptide receptor 1-like [Acanthaster planci]|uniref:Atrial natriuretic peptide receptor 1-like n=1 Tax=Acanthaster planci TaxID=133434 RepID=A0A8B7XWV7_ACAPL|nr:atrial natriuretic peptide receptor 1-like [Acanthaster planci]
MGPMSVALIYTLSLLVVTVHAIVDVKVGMLHHWPQHDTFIGTFYVFPAAQIAFETVAKRLETGQYQNFNMSYVSTDECCTRPVRSSGALAASMYYEHGVDAFLGPSKSIEMAAVADMAAYWNLPVITAAASSFPLADKARFATLTRTFPVMTATSKFVAEIFHQHQWTNCVLLRFQTPRFFDNIVPSSITTALQAAGVTVVEVFADNYNTLDRALEEAATWSNVIFICTSSVRDIMVHAYRLGYEADSYTFLHWYPFERTSWQTSSQFQNLNKEETEAMKALVVLRPQLPKFDETYQQFQRKLQERQQTLYGKTQVEDSVLAAATHDTVLMYADVINEIVAEGGDVRDGRAVTKKMCNRMFEGLTGTFKIGNNGDRLLVSQMLLMTGDYPGNFTVAFTHDEAAHS